MSSTSLDLSNKIPAEHANIIRQVVCTANTMGVGLFIVGAQARDLLLQHVYNLRVHRATNDIDFGIVFESWDEFEKLRTTLIANRNFEPHRTMSQRLVHESGLLIDLIPFGELEETRGQIAWPPDFSIIMSTAGFREAYDNSVAVRVADDLVVKVASLAGLALMKIIAWFDRRFERDAEDLGLIMRHYLDAGNQDRLYSEQGDCCDLLTEEFDYEKAGARILGRDIGRLLTDTSRPIVARALSPEVDHAGADVLATVMTRSSASFYGNHDFATEMLAELRTGLSDSDLS